MKLNATQLRVLRAINGNRGGGLNIGSKTPGQEIWAFVAPESFSIFKRLKENTVPISFPGRASVVRGVDSRR